MIHIPRANLARFCFNIINICTNYKCIPVFRTDARLGCPQLWPWHLTPAFVRRSKGSEDPQNPHLSSPLFLLVHSLPLHTETRSYSEVLMEAGGINTWHFQGQEFHQILPSWAVSNVMVLTFLEKETDYSWAVITKCTVYTGLYTQVCVHTPAGGL